MDYHRFSKRSLNALKGVHPALIHVTARALQLTEIDFVVTCGRRTREVQEQLVRMGKSKTMNSAHLTGCAVDVAAWVGGSVSWSVPHYVKIAKAFDFAACELGVHLRWGGDWDMDGTHRDERFFDGPHFELLNSEYDWNAPHPERYEVPGDIAALLHLDEEPEPVAEPVAEDAAPARAGRRRDRRGRPVR